MEARERRRRVRDEPLLKLKAELARMATKNERLVNTTKMLHTAVPAPPKEELKKWIDQAVKDFNDYMESGEFGQVFFTIDDKELVEKVDKLQTDYRTAFYRNTMFAELPLDEQKKALTQTEELAGQAREIQDLINQRLEEL